MLLSCGNHIDYARYTEDKPESIALGRAGLRFVFAAGLWWILVGQKCDCGMPGLGLGQAVPGQGSWRMAVAMA